MKQIFEVTGTYSIDTPNGRTSHPFKFLSTHEGPVHFETMDIHVKDYIKKKFNAKIVFNIEYNELPEI